MRVDKVFKNTLLYIDNELRAEYTCGVIIFIKNDDDVIITKIDLRESFQDKILTASKAVERLLRFEPRYLNRLSEHEFILSSRGRLSLVDIGCGQKRTIFVYALGTKNPLQFCTYNRSGRQEIVFGDYGGHDEKGDVGIYRYCGERVEKIALIPGGLINHIHRVEYDAWRDCYWVFTGDSNAGSGIWRFSYGQRLVEPFLLGSQQYRMDVVFLSETKMVYATDSPIEKNHVYVLDIPSKQIDRIMDLPGSCIFGGKTETKQGVFYSFITAVEPDTTLPTLRYRLTAKLGNGIHDRYSHVFAGNVEKGFTEIWKSKKDWMPMWLFQFGNMRIPTQNCPGRLYVCPQSSVDKGTYAIDLNEE